MAVAPTHATHVSASQYCASCFRPSTSDAFSFPSPAILRARSSILQADLCPATTSRPFYALCPPNNKDHHGEYGCADTRCKEYSHSTQIPRFSFVFIRMPLPWVRLWILTSSPLLRATDPSRSNSFPSRTTALPKHSPPPRRLAEQAARKACSKHLPSPLARCLQPWTLAAPLALRRPQYPYPSLPDSHRANIPFKLVEMERLL